MSILENIDDSSTAYLVVSFYDEDGAALTPTAATYRIDTDAGVQVKNNTVLTPASTITITLAKEDNRIASTSDQVNVVTVQATWSTDKQLISEYRYNIKYLTERPHLYPYPLVNVYNTITVQEQTTITLV